MLVTTLCVDSILFRTHYAALSTYFADKLAITDASRSNSSEIVERVVDEGIVLAQNDDSMLPLSAKKLNLFGWAGTNPIYGGSGSGASDESANINIVRGLQNAGIEVNQTLVDFYKACRSDHPAAATSVQGFTLPEPAALPIPKKCLWSRAVLGYSHDRLRQSRR